MSDIRSLVKARQDRRNPLDEKELAFIEAWVDAGADERKVMKDMELKPAELKALLADQRVRDAIDLARDFRIRTVGATKAWAVIDSIMHDPAAPAQVRLKAAQWTLESAGHGLAASTAAAKLGMAGARKDFHQMTEAELLDFVNKGKQAVQRVEAAGKALKEKINTIDMPTDISE